jgi:hypothetical protein
MVGLEKNSAHRLVFMPVWDIGELQSALEALELKIEDDVLEERFAFFGGSARYCLSTDLRFVLKGRDKVNKALGKIEGFEMVKDCFDGNLDLNKIVHRLMYYRPDDPERDFASLFPASVEISIMLKNRLDKKLSNERAKLMHWLDGAGKASVFSGWLFENFVHEVLLDGGRFEIRSLEDFSVHTLPIDPTIDQYERFKPNFTLEEVFKNVYRIPEPSSQPSIDSYILTGANLILFQITRNPNHPISSAGLVVLFKRLNLLNGVRAKPVFAMIIFVVPKGLGSNFPKQSIVNLDVFSMDDIKDRECCIIHGIKQAKKRKLDDIGIRNCQELTTIVIQILLLSERILESLLRDWNTCRVWSFC